MGLVWDPIDPGPNENAMTHARPTRRRALGLLTSPAALTLAGRAPAFAQAVGDRPKIRVINTAGTSNYVFEDLLVSQGILDRFGIEATHQNVADGTKVTEALLSGQADVCMQSGFAPVMAQIEAGAPFRIIAGGNMLNPQAVYSAKPEVRELKDLVGRTVGVGAFGAAMHQKIVALLRKRGIDEKTVKFVDLGGTPNIFKAVREGQVDAGPADIDVYADQAKYGVHSLRDGDIWSALPEYTNQASYTTLNVLAEKRDALVRIVAAYAALYRFLESPRSLQPWLVSWAKIAKTAVPAEPDPLWKLYQAQKPFPPGIALSPERIKYVQALNVSMGLQKHILAYDQVADTSIARDALKLVDKV